MRRTSHPVVLSGLALAALAGCPAKNASPEARSPAAVQACVSECVQRNQMRAVSPEQIEADCQKECERATPTPAAPAAPNRG